LIISYCEHGSLLALLRKRATELSPLGFKLKLKLAVDVAKGMEHLASLHFIHRDVAARNVLVATGMIGQVADFGLSRGAVIKSTETGDDAGDGNGGDGDDGPSEEYYRSQAGVFPIRWTAPEAMETLKFSTASDVWSFAIVMVELFQDGAKPYGHIKKTADVMQQVMGGNKHPKPDECPPGIYESLCQCWSIEPRDRPDFKALVATLSVAGPAVEKRKAAYKKMDSANNEYNEMGFVKDNDEVLPAAGVDAGASDAAGADDGYLFPDSHTQVGAASVAAQAQSTEDEDSLVYEIPNEGLPSNNAD